MAAGCWATICFADCLAVYVASCILRTNRTRWPRLRRGSANKPTVLAKTQALCGMNAIFRSYTHSLYVCLGAGKMKACLVLSSWPWDILAVLKPVTLKKRPLWLWTHNNGIVSKLLQKSIKTLTGLFKHNFCQQFNHCWFTRYIKQLVTTATTGLVTQS